MLANKDFKIKLIHPCRFETHLPDYYIDPIYCLPYGMGILTASLRQNNYYVEQEDLCIKFNRHKNYLFPSLRPEIDMDISPHTEEIGSILETGNFKGRLGLFVDRALDSVSLDGFNLIGFSILSDTSLLFAILLSKRIKQRVDVPIVYGGPFITLFHSLYPKVFDLVDYMIVGDGRIPLLRLVDYLNKKTSLSQVPNLIYKDDGKLTATLPLRLYKESRFMGPRLPYQITRGCASRCSFCNYKNIDPRIEFKSYGKVLNELTQMKERYHNNNFFLIAGQPWIIPTNTLTIFAT
jgi:hypothetical protein